MFIVDIIIRNLKETPSWLYMILFIIFYVSMIVIITGIIPVYTNLYYTLGNLVDQNYANIAEMGVNVFGLYMNIMFYYILINIIQKVWSSAVNIKIKLMRN